MGDQFEISGDYRGVTIKSNIHQHAPSKPIKVQNLRTCVVQICGATGAICGTGFIISADTVVTCAHVVELAGVGPGKSVNFVFGLVNHTCSAVVVPEAWRPADSDDIAILRLPDQLPTDITPAILGPSDNVQGHTFRAFGYPKVGEVQGVWAEGDILGLVTDTRDLTMLQLRAQEIARGMSGAPVLDTDGDRVVGMLTATYHTDETLKLRDAAFATPIEAIAHLWPGLRLTPATIISIDPDNPPIAAIRDLLLAAFTPKDLRRFCQDRPGFRPLITKFAPGRGLNDMVDRVIDYCQAQLLWEDLLSEIGQVNPRQFARFESRLRKHSVGGSSEAHSPKST